MGAPVCKGFFNRGLVVTLLCHAILPLLATKTGASGCGLILVLLLMILSFSLLGKARKTVTIIRKEGTKSTTVSITDKY